MRSQKNASPTRAWFGTFTTNLLLLVIGVSTGVIAARVLGPAGRGELAECVLWATLFANLGNLGVPLATTVEVSKHGEQEGLVPSIVMLSAFLGLGAFCILFCLIHFWEISEADMWIYVFLIAYIPIQITQWSLAHIEQGRQRFAVFNFLRLIPQALYLCSIMLMYGIYGNLDTVVFLYCMLFGVTFTIFVRFFLLRESLFQFPKVSLARAMLTSGLQMHAAVVVRVIQTNADRIMIIVFLSQTMLGVYAVALTVAGAGLNKLGNATTAVLLPKITETEDDAVKAQMIATAASANLFVAGVLNLLLAVISPWLIPVLFGTQFQDAISITMLLCCSQIFASQIENLTFGLRGYGDWKSGPRARLIALAVFLLLGLSMLSLFDLIAIGLGLLVGYFCGFIYMLTRAAQVTGLMVHRLLVPPAWLFSPSLILDRLR